MSPNPDLASQFHSIEGNPGFVKYCSQEFLDSLSPESRRLIRNGEIVKFLFQNDADTCEWLAREVSAYFEAAMMLYKIRAPEEYAENQRILDSLAKGIEL